MPIVHPLSNEDLLSQSLSPVSSIIYSKFATKLHLLKQEYYQKIIKTLQYEHHYSYSQALQAVYWRLFSSTSSTNSSNSRSIPKEDGGFSMQSKKSTGASVMISEKDDQASPPIQEHLVI